MRISRTAYKNQAHIIFELMSKRKDMGNTSPPALGSVLASKVGSSSPPYLEFGDF